jgi:tRNA threonylcarbamoyl adenosine modification protein YeaZ
MILAYETATNICSVAFQNKNGEVFEKIIQGRSVHSDNLFLFTQQLQEEHTFEIKELDAVLVSIGPGSYTGLRIAASAIKGLLFDTEVDLYAVNTLASFAVGSGITENTIHAIIDARRTHVYHQSFTLSQALDKHNEARLIELSELEELLKAGDSLIGTGIGRIEEEALSGVKIFDETSISAKTLIKLFHLDNYELYCEKTSPEELNSNYISTSQINNSKS